MENLFVYGTLLFEEEEPSHGIKAYKYIDESIDAWVKGTLYVVEGFPFVVLDDRGKVKGKLFRCNDIEPLIKKYDKIEGADQVEPFFERKETDVILESGENERAYCYVGGKKLRECFAKEEYRVPEGDWLKITEE